MVGELKSEINEKRMKDREKVHDRLEHVREHTCRDLLDIEATLGNIAEVSKNQETVDCAKELVKKIDTLEKQAEALGGLLEERERDLEPEEKRKKKKSFFDEEPGGEPSP